MSKRIEGGVMILSNLNATTVPPKTGDVLVIATKRNKGEKAMVVVKDILNHGDGIEVILQKGRNKYFNWNMYLDGSSWVYKCWNLGSIKLTSGLNNTNLLDDC